MAKKKPTTKRDTRVDAGSWPTYGTILQNTLATIAKRLEDAKDAELHDSDADEDLIQGVEKLTTLAESDEIAQMLKPPPKRKRVSRYATLLQEKIAEVENHLIGILDEWFPAPDSEEEAAATPSEETAEEISHCIEELRTLARHRNITLLLKPGKPKRKSKP